jgi:NitT/TauT family transport system substrate-binding protein
MGMNLPVEGELEMPWKKISLSAALTVSLFGLTACMGGGSQKAEEVRITEVIRSIFYAPQYVAMEKGYFKEQGLNVTLDTAWGGDKAMTRLLAGQADVALIGAETTVYVEQQGSGDNVMNFAQVTQRDGTFLVARNKIENFDWSMLKGKSLIGSRKGSMPEMVSEYVQKKKGIQPNIDNTIIQNITFDNQASAFASGTGDFFQAFEPNASILEKAGQGHVVASFGKDGDKLPYTVYMSKSSYMKRHPDAVQKFTNAVQKAQNFVDQSSPEEVATVIAPFFDNVENDILVAVVKRYKEAEVWAKDPIIDEDEWNSLIAVMKEAGELKGNAPYSKLVNTDYATKAKQ